MGCIRAKIHPLLLLVVDNTYTETETEAEKNRRLYNLNEASAATRITTKASLQSNLAFIQFT